MRQKSNSTPASFEPCPHHPRATRKHHARREDPHCARWPARLNINRRALPPRRHRREHVLLLVQGVPGGGKRRSPASRRGPRRPMQVKSSGARRDVKRSCRRAGTPIAAVKKSMIGDGGDKHEASRGGGLDDDEGRAADQVIRLSVADRPMIPRRIAVGVGEPGRQLAWAELGCFKRHHDNALPDVVGNAVRDPIRLRRPASRASSRPDRNRSYQR